MHSLFGIIFNILYMLKLSTGKGFCNLFSLSAIDSHTFPLSAEDFLVAKSFDTITSAKKIMSQSSVQLIILAFVAVDL